MSRMIDKFKLIDEDDHLFIIGILLFLFGTISTYSGFLNIQIGFLTALGGLIFFSAGIFSLYNDIQILEKQKKL